MKIAVIGSGNIATFFSFRLWESGNEIVQVISGTLINAKELASNFHCKFSDSIDELTREADVYLFAIKDDILLKYAFELNLTNKIVIHCAGSISLDQIKPISTNVACIWSVFSINKNSLPSHRNIPLVLNASNDETLKITNRLATQISDTIYFVEDEQKKFLHLGAVFANNFTNHLYSLSKSILEEHLIPFEILIPIIQDTAQKLLKSPPEENQTGPAVRGDQQTMNLHLSLLKNEQVQEIYKLISENIQRT